MALKVLAALGLSAGLMVVAGAAAAQTQGLPKNDYGDKASWLCRPDKTVGNACKVDLSTTVVKADGTESVEAFHADSKAPIDCFYVYPTVSNDPGVISDMNPGPEETNVVKVQFARLGAKCRLFAPLYRQVTLTALVAGMSGKPMPGQTDPAMRATGYNDVVDAWNYYLAHDNHGRGVVLVGHSQGSGVLTQVIKNEIDGKPVEKKLVSAILMGTRLPVEEGKDTGLFQHVPLCRSASQTGCVIAYASFRDTVPPPANSLFGKAPKEGEVAACTNPANLAPGAKGAFHAYMSNIQIVNSSNAVTWVKGKPNPKTPFVEVPGLLTGQCVQKNGFSYLEVHVNANPADPRADDINGDVVQAGKVNPAWGLHLIDANLAMGNLVAIVGAESKAYLAKAKK
jgi:hypothetical protein